MKRPMLVLLFLIVMLNPGFGQESLSPEAQDLLDRAVALDQQNKTEEALKLLNEGIETYREPTADRFFILNYKFILLSRQQQFDQAINIAIEKANIIQSPKQALIVAETYLKLGELEQAIDWLEQSVERGLQSYDIFNDDKYEPLRGRDRFYALIDTVKKRIGIGQPAKPFVRRTIASRQISLSEFKGKVVLIDFWATWCLPCREQMPHLISCYDKYRDMGFEIIGFSEDKSEKQLSEYLKSNKINWENILCPNGEDDETVSLYKVINIPASFLVDRRGIIRHVNLTGEDLEKAIEELL